jgi:ribosomal protein S18 acetylase RimI-like enzyme
MILNISIQKAIPEDAQEIGEVYYKTWLATYINTEFGVTKEDIDFIFKDIGKSDGSKYLNLPADTVYFTAKENDHVVGVCKLIKHNDKNELKSIYILPKYQGMGVGKKFWEEALHFFDSTKDTLVKVVTYNRNAIEFYKRLGFKETGKIFYDETFRMQSGAIPPETEMIISANNTVA